MYSIQLVNHRTRTSYTISNPDYTYIFKYSVSPGIVSGVIRDCGIDTLFFIKTGDVEQEISELENIIEIAKKEDSLGVIFVDWFCVPNYINEHEIER